jgi:type II site-specific deoxyribonuclease
MKKEKEEIHSTVVSLVDSVLQILDTIGIPVTEISDRRKVRMAKAVLAVAGVTNSFDQVKSSEDGHFLTTREIIDFENTHLGEKISSGSYDDIRRKDLKPLTDEGYIISSSSIDKQSTNNPRRGYAVNSLFADLIKSYGTNRWEKQIVHFKQKNGALKEALANKRTLEQITVRLPSDVEIRLSFGAHNELQRDIIQEFLSRFGFGADVLYLGDTTDKGLIRDEKKLRSLGFFELGHEELPDVIAYSEKRNLLFIIEAVHSSGQMSESRVKALKNKLKNCTASLVFISAFESRKSFRKFSDKIAWETEVWISENPDHMIHFNGSKFIEIHKG